MNHKKPTPEELQANIDKAAQEAALLENQQEPEPTPEPTPEPEPEAEPEPIIEPAPAPEPEPSPAPEPKPEVDYKTKFTESTREAQILHAQNKKINEAVQSALSISDPTEEELKKEFSEWDSMTDTEKRLAKDNLKSTKRFAMLEEVTKESKDIEAWNGKVDTFLDDPKSLIDHPELEGKVEEFKIFATKPTRRGLDFEDLVLAFNGASIKDAKPKNKGAMFETGTGGPNDKIKPKSDKIGIEEASKIKATDYKRYVQLLRSGKIDLTI